MIQATCADFVNVYPYRGQEKQEKAGAKNGWWSSITRRTKTDRKFENRPEHESGMENPLDVLDVSGLEY